MPEIVYDQSGAAFVFVTGGAHSSGAFASLRDAVERSRSTATILEDSANRDAMAEALVRLGRISPTDATSMPFEELRTEVADALGRGALHLQPYTADTRFVGTIHEPAAPSLSEMAEPIREMAATHTLELELIDAQGEPVPNEPYRVELPSGEVIEGRLNSRGTAMLTGIEGSGNCVVNFPNWDKDAWAPQ